MTIQKPSYMIDSPIFRNNSEPPASFKCPSIWGRKGTNFFMALATEKVPRSINLSPPQIVKWLKDDGLPISTIADIMNVERKTVYAWLKEGAIKEYNIQRLEQIHKLLSENKTATLRNLYRFWTRKLSGNKSLSILFKERKINKLSIQKVLKKAWPLAVREQVKEGVRSTPTTILNNPILRESRVIIPSDDV